MIVSMIPLNNLNYSPVHAQVEHQSSCRSSPSPVMDETNVSERGGLHSDARGFSGRTENNEGDLSPERRNKNRRWQGVTRLAVWWYGTIKQTSTPSAPEIYHISERLR
eukprot:scaffold739_cov329-Amphora_coffeaeformis.AAC.2